MARSALPVGLPEPERAHLGLALALISVAQLALAAVGYLVALAPIAEPAVLLDRWILYRAKRGGRVQLVRA